MPATITHSYFAYDVYNNLSDNIKKKVDLDRLKMFAQGSDPFMFYYSTKFKYSKKIRRFHKKCHTTKTKDYFINLINYIKDNKLYDDIDVCSYLVGFICHYSLDSTAHPYIYYKTGYFKKKVPNTYKYNNIHAFAEVFFDNYMVINRESIDPYKFNLSKFCFDNRKFSNSLNDSIKYSFNKTYKYKDMDKTYYKSIKYMKCLLYILRRDRFGVKKFFYKLIDTFTPRSVFRFEALSYHQSLEDKHNYLNSNHELWRNPIDYNLTSNSSFVELYLDAIKESINIINNVFKYFDNKRIDLDKLFTNKSYVTGLDCNIKKELKYFEF